MSENIIIQNPNVVSVLNSTDVFAFDKSGTLTVGEHIITDVYTFGGHTEKQVLEYAVSIESVTDHPLSDAIFEYAFSQGISEKKVDDLKTLGGEGVRAVIDGKEVLLGDYTIFDMPTECEAVYKKLLDEEKTVAFMVIDSVPAALIAAADSYKEGALELLAALKKSGIKTHLLADDVLEGTDTLACEIYEDGDVSESFPDVKALRIKSIKSAGNSVAMVGDGINDTVALIIADVAISVGTATAAALEASDIIIKSDNLSDIMKVINLSKLYTSISQQNIVLSTVFNLLLIPFVLLTGVRGMLHLSESVLIVAVLSVFAVIINTLRVKNKGM